MVAFCVTMQSLSVPGFCHALYVCLAVERNRFLSKNVVHLCKV